MNSHELKRSVLDALPVIICLPFCPRPSTTKRFAPETSIKQSILVNNDTLLLALFIKFTLRLFYTLLTSTNFKYLDLSRENNFIKKHKKPELPLTSACEVKAAQESTCNTQHPYTARNNPFQILYFTFIKPPSMPTHAKQEENIIYSCFMPVRERKNFYKVKGFSLSQKTSQICIISVFFLPLSNAYQISINRLC